MGTNPAKPFIGIDFGTSKSTMAWYDPQIGRAELILNAEGKSATPSIVYFGQNENEILVGERAERKLEQSNVVQSSFVLSVKRNLVTAPAKIVGNKIYKPQDIASKILQKLKEDAEKGQFHQPVTHAVITHPASFDTLLQDKIRQAAMLAGFSEVELLAEPAAAALAYMRTMNFQMGNYALVYDFGGGTFDVAVLERLPNGLFNLALTPKGLRDCGGDDLDRELYYYCEEIALQTLKRGISLNNDLDLQFLRQCRKRKENLSSDEEETFSTFLPAIEGSMVFEHTLKRETFESRIKKYVEHTVSLTKEVMQEAKSKNCTVDTVVLVGGSSRIPLVLRSLSSALPVQPLEWQQKDYAVALGAAYYAQQIWGPKITKPPIDLKPPVSEPDKEANRIPLPPPPPELIQFVLEDTFTGQAGPVYSVAISPDGQMIVSGSFDRTCKVRNLQTKQLIGTLTGYQGAINSIALSPNGQMLVTGSADNTIKVWNPHTGILLYTLGVPKQSSSNPRKGMAGVSSVAISPDEQLFISRDQSEKLKVWELSTGELRKTIGLAGRMSTVAAGGELLKTIGLAGRVSTVAVGSYARVLTNDYWNNTIKMWNLHTGGLLSLFKGHTAAVNSLTFSSDGHIFASGSNDGTVKVWQYTGRLFGSIVGHSGPVNSVAISSDGQLIVSGSVDNTIKVWELRTGNLYCTLKGHLGPVYSVAISSDGQVIVSGSEDGTVRIWRRK